MTQTEQWLDKIENELRARKAAYERSATTLPVYSKQASITTTPNALTITLPDGTTFTANDDVRIVVTYRTNYDKPVNATVEVGASTSALPTVRRIPYNAGARWVVLVMEAGIHVNVMVHATMDGALTLEEAHT
nr:MAG TPA: hypothetical protein [Caudoviricetes sp.]